MKTWTYSARWFEKNQEVTLLRDIQVWDQVKLFGKNAQEFKVFREGTKAIVADYLGNGSYELQIGENTIYHVPGFCFTTPKIVVRR